MLKKFMSSCLVFFCFLSFHSVAMAEGYDQGVVEAYARSCRPQYSDPQYSFPVSCIPASALSGYWTDDVVGTPHFDTFDDYAEYKREQALPTQPGLILVYKDLPQINDSLDYTPTSNNIVSPIHTNVIGGVPQPDGSISTIVLGEGHFMGNCSGSGIFSFRSTYAPTPADAQYPLFNEMFCVYLAPVRNSCPDGTCGLNSVDIPNSTQYSSTPGFTILGSTDTTISQYYNSSNAQWSLSMDKSIGFSSASGGQYATVQNAMGNRDTYTYNTSTGSWVSNSPAVSATLTNIYSNNTNNHVKTATLTGYQIVTPNNITEIYDINGHIISSKTLGQGVTTMTRDTLGRINQVTTPNNQSIKINYKYTNTQPINQTDSNANSIIDTITLPNNQTITYGENTSHQMTSVTLPNGTGAKYTYNTSDSRLSTITDLNNNLQQQTTYGTNGVVASTSNYNGRNAVSYDVSNDGIHTTGTDANNNDITYNYTNIAGSNQVTSMSSLCTTCSGLQGISTTYDASSDPIVITDYNGNSTHISWDMQRKLPLTVIQAYNTPLAKTTTYTWDSSYNIPTDITQTVAGGTRYTHITYDANGNIKSKSVKAPLNDGTTNTNTRTENYSYNAMGQILSYSDALNNTTNYQYDGSQHLTSMTNALNQVTTYSNYNSLNLPGSITYPNGLVASVTYDGNGKILSTTLNNTQTTTYSYDINGYPNKITNPDGSYLVETNDPNGLVLKVQHYGEDNYLVGEFDYTYDAMSHVTQVSKYFDDGSAAYSAAHKYNNYNLLSQDINSFNSPYQYAYDPNGNMNQTTDQLSHTTQNKYDALNRLIEIDSPDNSVSKYGYDAGSRLNQVTDDGDVVTNYTYDGFDDIIKVQSPDSGTTYYSYNAVGKVTSKTDARGIVSTYSYDSLNRLTGVSYNTTPATLVNMTYDTCQVGKLCSITDKTGLTSYNYDIYGNVINKLVTIGSKTFTTQYAYNTSNLLTNMTLPSGDTQSMDYYAHRVNDVNVQIGAGSVTSLIKDVNYYPMGPILGFHYGNNQTHERDLDSNYFWSAIKDSSASDVSWTYNPNADGTIDTMVHANPRDLNGYTYDSMQRITEYDSLGVGGAVENYTYDGNANRKTKTLLGNTGKTTTYHYMNNRLFSLTGNETQSFTYDAMGDMTGDGTYTYTYDEAGRMQSATNSTNTINYQVNYLGLRVSKTVNGVITYFIYDENNQLIGEYDQNSNPIKEHIYLSGMPVGLITNSTLYYVHPDHLGSPRVITDINNNVLWTWKNANPFGNNLPTENGITNYNLRFPGQYFDNDTKLNYNFHRDYNPNTGRYSQADPIGLNGGLNLYSYAGGNSVNNIDMSGLVPQNTIVLGAINSNDLSVQNMFSYKKNDTTPDGFLVLIAHASYTGLVFDINSELAEHLDYSNPAVQTIIQAIQTQGKDGVMASLNSQQISTLLTNSNINLNNYKGIVVYGCNYATNKNGINQAQDLANDMNMLVVASNKYIDLDNGNLIGYSNNEADTELHKPGKIIPFIYPNALDVMQVYYPNRR